MVRALTGAAATIGLLGAFALIAIQAYFFIGVGVPVVREHCLTGSGPNDPLEVETRWRLAIPVLGAIDDAECVRNTPFREGLGAIGIWELDDPRRQIEAAAAARAGGHEGYLREMIDLRREGESLGAALAEARTPEEVLDRLREMRAWAEELVDRKRAVEPPPELRRYHEAILSSGERALEVIDDMVEALGDGDQLAYGEAVRALAEEGERSERAYRRLERELEGG